MKVKARLSYGEIEIKSIEDAITAFLNMGDSNNAAVLIRRPGKSSMLTYEGLARSEPSGFKKYGVNQDYEDFLYDLFDQFVYRDDFSKQSVIRVHKFSIDEQRRSEYAIQITLLLYLKNEFVDAAEKCLKKQADSAAKTDATIFYLD